MFNKNINKITVLAIFGLLIAISINEIPKVGAVEQTIFQYGSIAQEDELMAIHDGNVYVNTVYEDHSGNFRLVEDMDTDYSIDQAIERFGINEDVTSFEVKPSFTTISLVFQLDNDLQFQLIGAVE